MGTYLNFFAKRLFLVVLILILLALLEILCLEYNWGFQILSEPLVVIVGNVSYAFLTSGIFYLLIVELPSKRNKNIYDKLIYKRILLLLQIGKHQLDDLFRRNSLEPDAKPLNHADRELVMTSIREFGIDYTERQIDSLTDDLVKYTDRCLEYKLYLDAMTFKKLDEFASEVSFSLIVQGQEIETLADIIISRSKSLKELYVHERTHLKKLFKGNRFVLFTDWDS